MGMYDNVIVNYPLPGGGDGLRGGWQTKSLECTLETYKITRKGKLKHRFSVSDADHSVCAFKFYPHHGALEIHNGYLSYGMMFNHGKIVLGSIIMTRRGE